jgi:hypothetical protein
VLLLLHPLASFSEGTDLFAFWKGHRQTSHFIRIFISWYIGWTCTLAFFRFSAHYRPTVNCKTHQAVGGLPLLKSSEYTDKGRLQSLKNGQ